MLAELAGAVDLVLTDVAMPGGLGSDLALQIRSTQRWVRVIFMSSYSREPSREARGGPGQAHFLGKPFQPAQLLRTIREALTA